MTIDELFRKAESGDMDAAARYYSVVTPNNDIEAAFKAGARRESERYRKLVEAVKRHHDLWNQSGVCLSECSDLCRALKELEGSGK